MRVGSGPRSGLGIGIGALLRGTYINACQSKVIPRTYYVRTHTQMQDLMLPYRQSHIPTSTYTQPSCVNSYGDGNTDCHDDSVHEREAQQQRTHHVYPQTFHLRLCTLCQEELRVAGWCKLSAKSPSAVTLVYGPRITPRARSSNLVFSERNC